jgi:transcriptional regulator of heat shock response
MGKAMCTFSVELIDFDQLSDEQTKNLRENYERKKKALQAQLEEANRSLKGITRALEIIEEKTKEPRVIQSAAASSGKRAYLS